MKTETKHFKRVTMSLTDIQICLKYLDKILVCEDDVIHRALAEAIIISYVRPISGYKKEHHNVVGLKKEFKKQFNTNELKIHTRICNLRNSIIAHSDSKSYGVTFNIFKLHEDFKMVIPTLRRVPILLTNEDINILQSCCLKIERYLFNEQKRIKDLLPAGNY